MCKILYFFSPLAIVQTSIMLFHSWSRLRDVYGDNDDDGDDEYYYSNDDVDDD